MPAKKAKEGVVNIHGKEYKTVALRVQEFHAFNNDMDRKYGIITEVLARDNVQVCVKAQIVDTSVEPVAVVATGHAEEFRRDGKINRTSALENAETSAIGRALAAFGFGGSEFASANEVQGAVRQQSEQIRPEQVKAINALLDSGKITTDHLTQRFGHKIVTNLFAVEADRIINALKAQPTKES